MGDGQYALAARLIHWLMAVGFIFMWACGYAMSELVPEDSALQEFLFGLHISAGVTLLFLLALRIALRLAITPPPLPEGLSWIEQAAAQAGHLALYLLPALIITAGWAETDLGGHGVTWFGIAMPKIFPTLENWAGIDLEDLTSELHEWLAYLMLALAVLHVLAVVKHRWVDGHDVLHRMSLGGRG